MTTARKFAWAVGALVLVMILASVVAIANSGDKNGPLASVSELRDKQVIEIDEEHLFLVYNDGEPLALSDDPQHLEGEHTEWCDTSQMFETPTHGEKFDRRGIYFSGPARRGLDRYRLRVEGDQIYVDTDQMIAGPHRGAEDPLEPEGPFCVEDG